MKEERILADVEWCKGFEHVTPLEMAQGMILNHAESLGREDGEYGFLDEFHLAKIRHWVEVKKRLNESKGL